MGMVTLAFNTEEFKDLYPFANHFFTQRSGFRQHYLDEGKGQPMVMVHGNPSWSFLYRDMVKAFRDDYRCIAPDHLGCGLSDKPETGAFTYTLKEHVDNLEALIDSLNLSEPLNLVVHDWGGAIGMGYATRHPDKVRRLVILNTGAFRLPADCPFPWPLWLFRNSQLGACINRKLNAFSFVASHTCTVKSLSRKIRHGFRAPYDNPGNRVATTRFVQDIPLAPGDPSYDELLRIENGLAALTSKPAIILFGRKDFVFGRYFYNEWRQRFPDAEAHSFHAGHYLLEDVGDKVFGLVRAFFARNA